MKNKLIAILVVIMVLVTIVPVHSFAVDPVSSATMANALAQAITAYGASQGVSMTFDVANTDGIGEGVKELWDNFKSDMESDPDYSGPTIQTYDTLSVSTWATLYKKIGSKVGIDLTAEVKSVFDGFWNWLLSGPAEMTKVDNQYYQWTINSESGTVVPIGVISSEDVAINGYNLVPLPQTRILSDGTRQTLYGVTGRLYCIPVFVSNLNTYYMIVINIDNTYFQTKLDNGNPSGSSTSGTWQYVPFSSGTNGSFDTSVEFYPSINNAVNPTPYLGSYNIDNFTITESGINVQPYVGDTIPQDVYIPDNTDVNYEPVAVEIPIDINWDDTLYGDGTDTLTDDQAQEIANALDNAIIDNPTKTLELADTANPIPDLTEVYIPFLPVELPNFEFSLSGIWHYVRDWVSSLASWFSMVFTIWSHLPYAIVVPVYASAVIVIVLGVYRRFFM